MSETGSRENRRGRDRLLRGALLAGLVAVVLLLSPRIPREQTLVVVLPRDESIRVVLLDVSWKQSDEDEPLGGVTLQFPEGAPSVVRHTMTIPNGLYVLTLRVESSRAAQGGAPPAGTARVFVRRVTLEGGETKLFLKDQDR